MTAVRRTSNTACQGLHNATFLSYESFAGAAMAIACHLNSFDGRKLIAALPGG
jgi:hypothetical protein